MAITILKKGLVLFLRFGSVMPKPACSRFHNPLCFFLLVFAILFLFESSFPANGILVSQIGYDPAIPMHALIRSSDSSYFGANTFFEIVAAAGQAPAFSGPFVSWGAKWGEYWWTADFSKMSSNGRFYVRVRKQDSTVLATSDTFTVRPNCLWDATWHAVSIEQLDARAAIARDNQGWQDCGSPLREVNSHVTALLGLFDLLEYAPARIPDTSRQRLLWHVKRGADYLALCQDTARSLGLGDGAVVHEIPSVMHVVTGDVAKSAYAFARASRLLRTTDSARSAGYLARAEKAFHWLSNNGPVFYQPSFNPGTVCGQDDCILCFTYANGAPWNFIPGLHEWKTCDLLMMTWAAVELSKSGLPVYRDSAAAYARLVMARQIQQNQAESGLYGHFRAFESATFSEKAWTHNNFGYDVGSTFPHYIIPFIEMMRLFKDHPDTLLWRQTIERFAYGYLLPVCGQSPFSLLPVGYFSGEGVLFFSGLWHGINAAYGSAAALAWEIGRFLNDGRFNEIIAGNMNWIAGLNAGFVDSGGKAIPYSMIYGIGNRFRGTWTGIPGTVCNGFDADPQFVIQPPSMATDAPTYFTDEDWITHGGAWLSALARLYADSMELPAVEKRIVPPPSFLLTARPNPFNASVNLAYGGPAFAGSSEIHLDVFSLNGKLVRSISAAETGAGLHEIPWDGLDMAGKETGSGVYFVRFRAGNSVSSVRLIRAR
jgi:hypothetical protein